jgi:spermidine synthase
MARLVYPLFFLSGASGLIYQVIWVREFGNVFGNTIHSASLVIAVFMVGLGIGSYLAGIWADRRYASAPGFLLRVYGYCEIGIAGWGLAVSSLLPLLGALSVAVSAYTPDAVGWHRLSVGSHVARYGIAVLLLAPITIVMGGTLTLLIRHLVGSDLATAGWTIGALYGMNTAGAAVGCFLTDYALVPHIGVRRSQLIAVLLNLIAGIGALRLASSGPPGLAMKAPAVVTGPNASRSLVIATGTAILLSGLAAMGMEIVWFRHLAVLLGSIRSVFSLLLTAILVGIWVGSLCGGYLHRRFGRPALWYMLAQALFVVSALVGVASADLNQIAHERAAMVASFRSTSGWPRAAAELWITARPLLREVALPAFLMGFAYPLANAMIQRAEVVVGRRAGGLYLANTLGAVFGALLAGFVLLPTLGIQQSVTVLALTAALGLAPLGVALRSAAVPGVDRRPLVIGFVISSAVVATTIALWSSLPTNYVITRLLGPARPGEQRLTVSEGLTEVLAVTEIPGERRVLITNGYSMSGTSRVSRRYMRAAAHIPLLSLEAPERVLVIGFGVGNTLHAASLHPSIVGLETADLSRHILGHASFFSTTNGGVITDPRLSVYINDGRHHLRMRPPASFDLITMEPPPIAHAGVTALYSRDFYELVRTRLKPKGYVTQWLPAYQVPGEATLSVVRAFIDVFPQSVLLSGFATELILMGVNDSKLEIDPALVQRRLDLAPAVREDMKNIDLGTLTEIVGLFAGSAETLERATRLSVPVTDDYPILEHAVRSPLSEHTIPASLFDVGTISAWCPQCFGSGRPAELADLAVYLTILGRLYEDPTFLEWPRQPSQPRVVRLDPTMQQAISRSPYLRQLVRLGTH